jgi:hypothetical protein
MIFGSAALGGLGSKLAGGDFFKGFAIGLAVGAFNHALQHAADDSPVDYSNKEAREFYKKYFGDYKSVRNIYADGRLGIADRLSADGMYAITYDGKEVFGITVRINKTQSDIYLFKGAFSSKSELYLSMGHEIIHANLNAAGYLTGGSHTIVKQHHAVIFGWESAQSKAFKMSSHPFYLQRSNILSNYTSAIPDYKKYWVPIKNIKPW